MIRAAIHGRLGSDPVQRESRTGKSMCTTSVAVNVAKVGEEAATEWFSLVAFGKAAEALAQHAKGDLVSAMGPLTRSTFQGRDGEERTSWSLLAESLLSARTVYDHPADTGATTRPRRARPSSPRSSSSRSSLYASPKRSGTAGPELPNDGVEDLWR
jgi:single-strand DNA-binding protein